MASGSRGAVALVVAAAALLAAPAAGANSVSSVCQKDGSQSVKVCVYQVAAFDYTFGGHERIDVTGYRVRVWNLDRHDATISSVLLRATAFGKCDSGCGHYSPGVVAMHRFRHIRSGRTYRFRVPWHAATIEVERDGSGYEAGNALLHWHYRGRSENFQSHNVCAGNLAGGFCNQ